MCIYYILCRCTSVTFIGRQDAPLTNIHTLCRCRCRIYLNVIHTCIYVMTLLACNTTSMQGYIQNTTCAHLAFHICCQQYVPGSKVSVNEALLGEVVHSISYLSTESQQLLWQLPAVRPNRPNKTQKCT